MTTTMMMKSFRVNMGTTTVDISNGCTTRNDLPFTIALTTKYEAVVCSHNVRASWAGRLHAVVTSRVSDICDVPRQKVSVLMSCDRVGQKRTTASNSQLRANGFQVLSYADCEVCWSPQVHEISLGRQSIIKRRHCPYHVAD